MLSDNPIKVDNFAVLFNCAPVDRASDSMMALTYSYSFLLVGTGALSSVASLSTRAQVMIFFCFRCPVVLFDRPGITICHATRCICCPRICFLLVSKRDLFVYRDDSLTG